MYHVWEILKISTKFLSEIWIKYITLETWAQVVGFYEN